MYVETKQFSKVEFKQNTISGSRVVYIFVYITKSVFYLISNQIFLYINQMLITDEKLKFEVQIEGVFIHIMN